MTNSTVRDAEERVEDGPLGRFLAPVADNWWLLLVTGVAWLLVSIVIFRFDYTTVAAVGVLFGIVALGAAANEVLLATVSSNGWRVAYLVMAGLSFVVGIVSFFHPGDTFVALAALVSFYLVFRGSFDLIKAFSLSRYLPGWWLLVITAIAELLIGFWAAGSWNNSVVVLVAWVGAAALTRGITEIVGAFQLREVGRTASR
ncbi:MAG: hypothetical protein QOK11_2240 [Pseudonocardiales bacterium]|nr:hypothetical protein [Pseudonocardiales bacterium]